MMSESIQAGCRFTGPQNQLKSQDTPHHRHTESTRQKKDEGSIWGNAYKLD